MLELGNKKNGEFTYKKWFESLGYRHVSVDMNGQDGALPKDLRKPLGLGTFDVVTNIGTSEHVSDQRGVWRNMLEAMHGVLISTTPAPGDWTWHGEYYPTNEFYVELASINGLAIERLYLSGVAPRRMWFARMVRVVTLPFAMPDTPMYYNVRR